MLCEPEKSVLWQSFYFSGSAFHSIPKLRAGGGRAFFSNGRRLFPPTETAAAKRMNLNVWRQFLTVGRAFPTKENRYEMLASNEGGAAKQISMVRRLH